MPKLIGKDPQTSLLPNQVGNIRVKSDLIQGDAAELLEVSRSTFAQYECGRMLMSRPVLDRFCERFNVSQGEVYGDDVLKFIS